MGGMCMSSCCSGGGGGGDDGSSLLLHLLIMVVVCLSVMAVCTSNERRTSVRVARLIDALEESAEDLGLGIDVPCVGEAAEYGKRSMLILDSETG
ncbi:hypothetical protein HID58_045502 [Brassica napus]|uniref:Uncharacterized protein n=1 Tax=Brassica napus TaxID=3708 RepID=A0ABQ8ATV3_BRANA|nr:hypothetical protein HID58_045502 [Brassica napus]